jgi:hypothetical protein
MEKTSEMEGLVGFMENESPQEYERDMQPLAHPP